MNSERNVIPENVRRIHLIAICGTGMGALACMLRTQGFEVSGSDHQVYPPVSTLLQDNGIAVMEGFDASHISPDCDLVVVGNAIRSDNPEAVRLRELKLPYCSMPQAINRFAGHTAGGAAKKSLVITGTHGKTTTSSLLAWILFCAGLDPTFIIGGILRNFGSNFRTGGGPCIVLEGDEYDTAYFDKGPKFMHYDPAVAVVTSIEFDHADIFKNEQAVHSAFEKFIRKIRPDGALLAFDQDPVVRRLSLAGQCRIYPYGIDAASPWRLGKYHIDPPWTFFDILHGNAVWASFRTRMMGEHNLWNAVAAVAAAACLNVAASDAVTALETFEGVKRRQEIRGCKSGVTVMDDFAHHPTAVRETIRAVRPFYPSGRIIAVFEPRTNSSMRKVFQSVYPLSFDDADIVCIRKPPLLHKIPPEERFSSEQLVGDLSARGIDAHFFPDTDAIIAFLAAIAKPGDLILVMSNGGFDQVHDKLLDIL